MLTARIVHLITSGAAQPHRDRWDLLSQRPGVGDGDPVFSGL